MQWPSTHTAPDLVMPIQRIDLRAYRESITRRLVAAEAQDEVPAALLGFSAGGERWLIDLPDAGEVLPVPALYPVPLTRPWFVGLASVHGELQAVTDFSWFCNGKLTERSPAARLLCIGSRLGGNAALLVEFVHGLKHAAGLTAVDNENGSPAQAWRGKICIDAQGARWTHLDVICLATAPEFIDAALPDPAGS